ncbi:MAG: hypothetical protein ACHRXM_17985 [Isosphaerales bacterium]
MEPGETYGRSKGRGQETRAQQPTGRGQETRAQQPTGRGQETRAQQPVNPRLTAHYSAPTTLTVVEACRMPAKGPESKSTWTTSGPGG